MRADLDLGRRAKAALAAALLAVPLTACPPRQPPQSAASVAPGEERLRDEATAFMVAYADELRAGDRTAIAARYDRRGAWRVGHGVAELETWDRIAALYASAQWQPPAAFEWQGLAYEPAGPDAVVVVGRFAWTPAAGQPPLIFSYTALLVRQDGTLRIRLEDESGSR